MQLSAVIAHPNFSLPNMTSLPLAVATLWSTPCSLRRRFGHSSQKADILVLAKRPYSGLSLGPNLHHADSDKATPMSSGDLIPNDHDQPELASNEVQFALVIARMINTVHSSPEHMRQAVYDLARYKLREQFNHADEREIRRTQQALEAAIRGVEQFSRQQIGTPVPPPVPQLGDSAPPPRWLAAPGVRGSARPRPHLDLDREPVAVEMPGSPWPPLIKWLMGMLVILAGLSVALQQRERLEFQLRYLSKYDKGVTSQQSAQVIDNPAPRPLPAKPDPLRPTDYGVYAISDASLAELQLLPGRALDIRVAVSAALKMPSRTILPNGHPKFIVFRRDATTNISDRADVRIVAKIAREFSAEAAGKKLDEGDGSWVIRNISFPFRSSPLPDNPEMYELHSEDPALELSPGRYALIVKNQAYDFTVGGQIIDPKQCIERILATNGTFYTDCKKL